jgi:hypothetical protein
MLLTSKYILCLTKASKVRKIYYFSLKNRVSLFIPNLLFFFLQINTKKKLYANVPKMPNLIQKQVFKNTLFFAVGITFFIANVFNLTRILLMKIENFEPSYLHEKLSYANTF